MHRFAAILAALAAAVCTLAAPAARAEMIGGNPGPQYNYVCPHADGQGPMDCYFDAVEHLYTMCRNVKSIEILTYGYEESLEGVNDAKYESCVEKQKQNMAKPYQAALKEARNAKPVGEALRGLHEHWLAALARLRWNRGESDADYKSRVASAYDDFRERIGRIKVMVAELKEKASPIASARAEGSHKAQKAPAHKAAPAKSATAHDKPPQS